MNNGRAGITLRNNTAYAARMTVKKSGLVVALVPAVAPGSMVFVPVTDAYDIVASTVMDGNTYTSAPISVTGSRAFLAQVIQNYEQGTYVFDVQELPSTSTAELQFQSTCRNSVVFTILKDGRPLQQVVCSDPFTTTVVSLGDTYSFQAVINGVTTDICQTDNPNATCTAINDTSTRDSGYYTLSVE